MRFEVESQTKVLYVVHLLSRFLLVVIVHYSNRKPLPSEWRSDRHSSGSGHCPPCVCRGPGFTTRLTILKVVLTLSPGCPSFHDYPFYIVWKYLLHHLWWFGALRCLHRVDHSQSRGMVTSFCYVLRDGFSVVHGWSYRRSVVKRTVDSDTNPYFT